MVTKSKFKEAILSKIADNDHTNSCGYYHKFCAQTFNFEGQELTGRELALRYNAQFPTEINYGPKARINRMLTECGISQFSYSSPEALRGFLLSAKSEDSWMDSEIALHDFKKTELQYEGMRIKGQMLLYQVLTEHLNKQNGTHYSFSDYLTNPKLKTKLFSGASSNLLKDMFRTAEIPTRTDDISEIMLNPALLKLFLLNQKTPEEWRTFDGDAKQFEASEFNLRGLKKFSGSMLRTAYEKSVGKKFSLEQLFNEAGLEISTDPSLLERKIKTHYEDFYSAMKNPAEIRVALLSVQGQEQWKAPQNFQDLRKAKLRLNGREVTLHTFLQLYEVHKYNQERQKSTGEKSCLTLGEMQEDSELTRKLHSNTDVLKEVLGVAGIDPGNIFVNSITDINLLDPLVLRRFLFNGMNNGIPLPTDHLNQLNTSQFRKVRFRDPQTDLEVSGHTLMVYYMGHQYAKQHPGLTVGDAVEKFHAGKSNKKVMEDIIARAGLFGN